MTLQSEMASMLGAAVWRATIEAAAVERRAAAADAWNLTMVSVLRRIEDQVNEDPWTHGRGAGDDGGLPVAVGSSRVPP